MQNKAKLLMYTVDKTFQDPKNPDRMLPGFADNPERSYGDCVMKKDMFEIYKGLMERYHNEIVNLPTTK